MITMLLFAGFLIAIIAKAYEIYDEPEKIKRKIEQQRKDDEPRIFK